ncbi:asparagine synthase (glutamine-hydrolyzing) [Sinorhizobium medicae]|uniref:asparagine synthase (glutamine-hydrolyzing) n=1 Tax=Sinorhizobium medicae TaxID=110321 RepID=UPI001294D847|nr:asparagine synthase (glutamine-hydrolyzing) [Sinorhizobium medicae]MDX0414780.1 asparagine synthase (glutamine-hydrolyzing) [Sinorhizobium medicae]MDX0469411.1 asparagine synthase (glutamine-hydrolyzing) [Sinorhizobium medicae]MDX0475734.1 asparagine synthase (glutamine-hydrolyzing) [Sinorhizobium medicae]MDX0900944.1 asparagine synthase (glutamine-hydrolyzing) [Sinorhizobium medicae]MDX1176555.1 asparagine synthase (glutamine-hydrolyzing) [Sinorhizobium medicae]
MCGIFGYIGSAANRASVEMDVERCSRLLAHRGPDAAGIKIGSNFAFGHRRLAIIDLNRRADQPFVDDETGVVLTYNGEIYNFREVRKELEQRGHRFRTESDTEVVCKAYAQWGMAALHRLRGMFAFGLYDQNKSVAYLVRDRMGIKPLYYAELPEGVVFGSQPSSLLKWRGIAPALDPIGLSSFLSFRAVFGERTLFEGIKKLPPGTWLKVATGRCETVQWWDIEDNHDQSADIPLSELIGECVREHLVADTPVAALLSGGLDSSILALEMSKGSGSKVTCFTGVVSGAEYDESIFAEEVANVLGTAHTLVPLISATDLDSVSQLTSLRCHPLGMHNETAMYKLATEVRRTHKVLLTGEGADELFAGYSRLFRLPFDLKRSSILDSLPAFVSKPMRNQFGLPLCSMSEFDLFLSRYAYFPITEKMSLASSSWRDQLDGDGELLEWMRSIYEKGGNTAGERIRNFFIRHHLPALLEMVDNTTMAAGVEARVPFTDHRLVARALRFKSQEVLRWKSPLAALRACFLPISSFSENLDTSKFPLRESYHSALPSSVLERRKLGFPLALGQWAIGEDSLPFRTLLLSNNAALSDYLDVGALRRWYAESSQRPHDTFGRKLWLLCNLEIFIRMFQRDFTEEAVR